MMAEEMTYLGHVQNGVIVLDVPVRLPEGVRVHVEVSEPNAVEVHSKEERLRQLSILFAHWNEEDANLSEQQADAALPWAEP